MRMGNLEYDVVMNMTGLDAAKAHVQRRLGDIDTTVERLTKRLEKNAEAAARQADKAAKSIDKIKRESDKTVSALEKQYGDLLTAEGKYSINTIKAERAVQEEKKRTAKIRRGDRRTDEGDG